jgi:hypothetical protein
MPITDNCSTVRPVLQLRYIAISARRCRFAVESRNRQRSYKPPSRGRASCSNPEAPAPAFAPSSSSSFAASSAALPRFPPIFYGNLTKRSRLTSRDILPFVLPVIRRSNMFVSIAESSRRISRKGKEKQKSRLILTVISRANMVPLDDTADDYIAVIQPVLMIIPPIGISRLVREIFLLFSPRRDFSCSFRACYSFVNRRSPFEKHRQKNAAKRRLHRRAQNRRSERNCSFVRSLNVRVFLKSS